MTKAKQRRPPTGKGLTFEKVWAMFQETDKKFQETDRQFKEMREESREMTEQMKETERLFKETREQIKETDRQMKETDKKIKEHSEQLKKNELSIKDRNRQCGELDHRFGELVEHLVRPGIKEKFGEMGYHLREVDPKYRIVKDEYGVIIAQIDILLENGETVMAVEVKSRPNDEDVKDHVIRLQVMRESPDRKKDKRKIMGAIAGAVFMDNVKIAARKAGLFVIEQSGDTMKIDMPEDFVPKAW
jgi:hypothetical protein